MKVVELIEMLMDLPREAMDEEILFTESRPSKAFGGDRLPCGKEDGLKIYTVSRSTGAAVGQPITSRVLIYGDLARDPPSQTVGLPAENKERYNEQQLEKLWSGR